MNRKSIKYILSEASDKIRALPETGTHEYSNAIDELITNLRDVKHTLRSGKNRLKYRKESGNLQRAIESLRYLRRQSERLIKDDYNKTDRLVERLDAYSPSGTQAITKCDIPATLTAIGIDSESVKKALSTALTDFVPYYLCSATQEASKAYSKFFIKSITMFNSLLEDILKSVWLSKRAHSFSNSDNVILRFEALNTSNFINTTGNDDSIYDYDKRMEKLNKSMVKIQSINPSGYTIINEIFNNLFDYKLRSASVYSGRISALNEQFKKEMKEAELINQDNPDLIIERARIGRDFLNAALQTIKKYYESFFGENTFPHLGSF